MFRTVTSTVSFRLPLLGVATGVSATIWLKETETTVASAMPKKTWTPELEKAESNIGTRVVAVVPKKRPPFKVRVVPPSLGPKLGLQEETNGSVLELGWKTIVRFADPLCPAPVAVAFPLAEPAPGPHSAVLAVPPCVATVTRGRPFCENVPKSEEKLMPVPSGTGFPFRVTIASISVQVPAL